MHQQADAEIDAKSAAMTDQMLKNYLSQGLATTGAITGPYAQIAGQQIQQDAALQAAAGKVFNAVGNTAAQQQGAPAP
jgi:hypothetical protein